MRIILEEHKELIRQGLLSKPRYTWTGNDARIARKVLGLTQGELGMEIDYTNGGISKNERCEAENIGNRVYELSLRYLLIEGLSNG